MLFRPEKNGKSAAGSRRSWTHIESVRAYREKLFSMMETSVFLLSCFQCSKFRKFRILWVLWFPSLKFILQQKPSDLQRKKSHGVVQLCRFEGSFPGLVKDETFCPDACGQFPRNWNTNNFSKHLEKWVVLKQREKSKLRLISTKVRQTDWFRLILRSCIQLLDKFLLMDKILGYDGRDPACDFLFLWKFTVLYLGFLPSSFDEG